MEIYYYKVMMGALTITALTLDMSDLGSAHFNNGLFIPNYIYHTGDTHTYFGFTGDDAWTMVLEGTTRLSVADSADPVFTVNAHLNMSSKDIDYVSQVHFSDNVRWRDNGNDSDLNFVYGDTGFGHLRFVDGNAAYQGGVYAESGYFGTLASDGTWAIQSSTTQTNITHKLEVQGNVDLKADNVNLDWMHADADQVLRIEIDSGNDAYFSVTGNNDFYFRTNSTTALTINGSQDATFAGDVTINNGDAYNQLRLTDSTAADTNKQSGLMTINYAGNNTSIFQTYCTSTNNTVYYGSADGNYRGITQHIFYVNAGVDATTSHTETLRLKSDLTATFAGNVTLNTKLIFDYGGDHYLQSGTDSLAYKTSGGTSVMSLNASTYAATFSGILTIPSYIYHTSDPSDDTYFGFSGNDTFTVYTAGGEGLNIDSNRAVTLTGALNIAASQKIYLGGSTARMQVYHTGSAGEAIVLNKEGNLSLVNQSHGDDIVFKTENSSGTVVTPLTLDSAGAATFVGQVTIPVTPTANAHAASKKYVDDSLVNSTIYQGTWDANDGAGGNPDLTTSTYKTNGYYFVVSVAGDATPNGPGSTPDDWHVGDWVIYNTHTGSGAWQKIDNSSVISGAGTGQKVVKWDGSGVSETLADGPITFSTNDSTFAGTVTGTSATFNGGVTIDGIYIDGTEIDLSSGTLTFDADAYSFLDGDVAFAGFINVASAKYITTTVPSGGGTWFAISHTGNESWTWTAQSGSGSDDYLDVGIGGGTRAMSWHEDGKIGIGTTTPGSKLSIEDGDLEFLTSTAASIKNKIIFSEAVWGDQSFWIEHDGAGAGAANLLKIYADGSGDTAGGIVLTRDTKVGIGTISPDAKLSVTSTGIASEDVLYLKSGADNVAEYLGIAFENWCWW